MFLQDFLNLHLDIIQVTEPEVVGILSDELHEHIQLDVSGEMSSQLFLPESLGEADWTYVSSTFGALHEFQAGLVRTEVIAAGVTADGSVVFLVSHYHRRMRLAAHDVLVVDFQL